MHIDIFHLPWQEPVLVFVLILFIILIVPIIFEKINIPSIIGLILAGILIGEHGFELISRDSSIELFGTVGLLYLMFIAGLEIDLNEFIKNKTKGIIFGLLTVLIPLTISIPIFYFFFEYNLNAAFLIGAIFVSHTLVTYPLVSKLGISKNAAVNISIAGTLIADVMALLILAVISNNMAGDVELMFWFKFVISILLFGFVVFFIFPIISRWFFKKYSDNILQYIYVLTIVFVSAFLAMLAGLEPIIGAFFAGLSLNRLIPHTSPLMNRVEFIGSAIFIPFFLIGVGMLINYNVLFSSIDALLITLVMAIIAVGSKYLAAILTRRVLKLSKQQGLLIFGLTNSRVAAALAIALIGYDIIIGQTTTGDPIRLLDENIFNGVIIIILITSTISSFATQKSAFKIAKDDLMKENYKEGLPTENTLIGLANIDTAENLIQLAISTVDKKKNNRIFGLHIITEDKENPETVNKATKLIDNSKKYAASADVELNPIIRYDLNITSGIINTIKEQNIQHFFIGVHQKTSIMGSFFGNLTSDLLKRSESAIYISKLHQPINTIKKYIIILPPYAELEPGFIDWYKRVVQITINTGNRFVIYANKETISFLHQKLKLKGNCSHKILDDYDDILIISAEVIPNSMLIISLARENGISYHKSMDRVITYLPKYFKKTNYMLVYPNNSNEASEESKIYSDTSLKDNVLNIKDTIEHIFKKQ